MNRRFLSAAMLIAASPLAQAQEIDASVSGYLAGSARYLDSDFEPLEDETKFVNNASRLSLEASLQQGDFTPFARLEVGDKNNEAGIEHVRQFYVGVETPWGQLVAGKKSSQFRLTGEALDPFYDTAVVGFNGREAKEGASYGLSNLTNGFSRNTIAYTSPVLLDGLRINGGVFVSSKDAPNDEVDSTLGAEYTLPGFGGEGHEIVAGVQYLQIENPAAFVAANPVRNGLVTVAGSPGESENYRVHARYIAPSFSLGASFEHIDVKAEPEARGYAFVSGTYAVSPTTRLAASYGNLDFSTGSPALSGEGYSLGVFHKLAERLNGYVAGRYVSLDAPGETYTAAVGLAYSFTYSLTAARRAAPVESAAPPAAAEPVAQPAALEAPVSEPVPAEPVAIE